MVFKNKKQKRNETKESTIPNKRITHLDGKDNYQW